MSRLACVDIPAFPLQLLLKEYPDWRSLPAVVVAEEKPQAFILWVNEKARRLGIRPGHRYAAGLALSRELRAGAIGESLIYKEVEAITERLRDFTPDVEPAAASWHSPGLFWLNASGLGHLFPSLESWGENIRTALDKMGFFASVAIGFSRFGTYAIARALRGLHVFESARDEDRAAQRVPLSRLDIPPDAQESFIKLRIQTVADFLRLPPKGLLKRFGPEVHTLHRLAAGDLFAPLAPEPPTEPLEKSMELPGPVADSERLLFFVKQLLDTLLQDLEAKSLALTKLFLRLELDDYRSLEEVLRPDAPTLASPLLLGLVRLRLETLRLDAGAVELCLRAEAVPKTVEQLLLAARKPKRDPRKQSRAFARLRAEFGDEAVVQAELLKGHLPSARFQWTPLENLPKLMAPVEGQRTLIRRIYEKPMALPPRSRHEPDGWMLRGLEFGPVRDFLGPYILSGGWWKRTVHREYYFVKMQQGDVFWVFYDRVRRRWFLEGRVE
ncbi:MAG: DNA polymerase Y family protein [Acidobacteria bacterium]|nr:MAG: DNA polymerase Y family protein [Acidobacteriota bacterium]